MVWKSDDDMMKKQKLLVFSLTLLRWEQQHKVYKPEDNINFSSPWAVTIFPGDREVAGCFYFSGGSF